MLAWSDMSSCLWKITWNQIKYPYKNYTNYCENCPTRILVRHLMKIQHFSTKKPEFYKENYWKRDRCGCAPKTAIFREERYVVGQKKEEYNSTTRIHKLILFVTHKGIRYQHRKWYGSGLRNLTGMFQNNIRLILDTFNPRNPSFLIKIHSFA